MPSDDDNVSWSEWHDAEREPVRRPRIRPQLTGRGSLRLQFERPVPDWLDVLRKAGAL